MYCTNCGKEISDTAKFCQFCGAQKEGIEGVKTEAVPAETMLSAQPSVPPMNTQQSVPPMNTQPGVPPMNVPVTPQVNAGATVPAQPQEKPKKKKGRIVVLVVLILVLIGVIAIGGLPAVLFGGSMSGIGSSVDSTVYSVGETISTADFSFTINEFAFVDYVVYGTNEPGNVATGPNDQGETIAWFNLTIENYGNETIDLKMQPISIRVGDIVYDWSNTHTDIYCIEKDDVSSDIAPLATKNFNYAIFNIPAGVLNTSGVYAEVEIYGTIYTIQLA